MYRKPLEDPRKTKENPRENLKKKNIEVYRKPLENPRKL